MKFPLQILGFHGLFSCQHLVRISLDGVDLTVMYEKTIGMSPLPAGKSIGREPGVHQRDGALIIRTLQIQEEIPKLPHQKHALVDQGPAGTGHHIGIVVGLLKDPPGDIELPVKIQSARHILGLLDKCLHNGGHLLQRFGAQNLRVRGHLSPAQEMHAFLFHDDLEHFLRLIAFQFILGQEKHADSIFPFASQPDPARLTGLLEKAVGDLDHDAHAVTGLSLCILSGPVLQVLHDT